MKLGTTQSDFPFSPWEITENIFSVEKLPERESVFALGNGYIGMRGNLEERLCAGADSIMGTYLNGVYASKPIQYGEAAYGYAENSQTICRVADAKSVLLTADGEVLDLQKSDVRLHRRTLDMQAGILRRTFFWHTRSGCILQVEFTRLVSLSRKHTAAFCCRVQSVSGGCDLTVTAGIMQDQDRAVSNPDDPRIAREGNPTLQLTEAGQDGQMLYLQEQTQCPRLAVACAAAYRVERLTARVAQPVENGIVYCWKAAIQQTQSALLEGYISYTSGDVKRMPKLLQEAKREAMNSHQDGVAVLQAEQRKYLQNFWKSVGIDITGDDATLQGLRFNLFHLLQSCGRDGKTNIAAKGLSGEGYEGHYFWDTEAYIFPFFLYTQPQIARKLLEYRYAILEQARRRARMMGHTKGALFPWRTINGEECSAYYPAGTAQYHINADIAYAVDSYLQSTRDHDFLSQYGAELLAETARLWYDLGFYNVEKGRAFCINQVTGPDEYNVLVDNNVYTNLMAQYNLRAAVRTLQELQAGDAPAYAVLCRRISLEEDELIQWQAASDAMYLPFDTETGLIPQDDAFFSRKPWPLTSIPHENFPLLLHYHPLVIYRHQVCKQADLIFAMVLFGNVFTPRQKRENFYYYDQITTHDSSLSMAIFNILASEIGQKDTAYQYFNATARLDLDNMQHNTKDGLHMANMAGTWLSLVWGFGGLRCTHGQLQLAPYLPERWQKYRFCLCFQKRQLAVCVNAAETTITLLEGAPLQITIHGTPYQLQTCIVVAHPKEENGRQLDDASLSALDN